MGRQLCASNTGAIRFASFKPHSGGRAKNGLAGRLERIGQLVHRHTRGLYNPIRAVHTAALPSFRLSVFSECCGGAVLPHGARAFPLPSCTTILAEH